MAIQSVSLSASSSCTKRCYCSIAKPLPELFSSRVSVAARCGAFKLRGNIRTCVRKLFQLSLRNIRGYVRTAVPDQWYISYTCTSGRPGGGSGYPRAWYRSFVRVRVPPSAHSYKFVGTLSCAHFDLRKAREREFATLDEKSTSSSGNAEHYAR